MSKYEVLIAAVEIEGLSYRQVAAKYGVSSSTVHRVHQRFKQEGAAGLAPRSRRPAHSPSKIPDQVTKKILALRDELASQGLDHGADTIVELLNRQGITVSKATVWRHLKQAGRITPQPQKRPRSSWQRFNADQPNECWQSDFTHIRLSTGQDIEVIGWLDDHSRYLLHLSAHRRVTGRTVIDTFNTTCQTYGQPTSTLTDNGNVYTTRFAGYTGGKNGFEQLLAMQGITQKNGRPYKPTTQGKIERLWQTLKKWVAAHPADTIEELQQVLDQFTTHYNTIRPHRSLGRKTPHLAYNLIPKATPHPTGAPDIWRVRYDRLDPTGKMSLRAAGRMMHLGCGRKWAGNEVVAIIHANHAQVVTYWGEIIADFTLDPTKSYQRKNG